MTHRDIIELILLGLFMVVCLWILRKTTKGE